LRKTERYSLLVSHKPANRSAATGPLAPGILASPVPAVTTAARSTPGRILAGTTSPSRFDRQRALCVGPPERVQQHRQRRADAGSRECAVRHRRTVRHSALSSLPCTTRQARRCALENSAARSWASRPDRRWVVAPGRRSPSAEIARQRLVGMAAPSPAAATPSTGSPLATARRRSSPRGNRRVQARTNTNSTGPGRCAAAPTRRKPRLRSEPTWRP
jgi:hypothetical protein